MKNRLPYYTLSTIMAVFCTCANLGGIGHEGEARISGRVTLSNGTPASQTLVMLFSADYDPAKDSAGILMDTTDFSGSYSFSSINSGCYSIQAIHLLNRTRAIMSGINVSEDTVIVTDFTLHGPGTIKVSLPDNANPATGYIYIPGSSCFVFLNNLSDFVLVDSVPAGTLPSIAYSSTNSNSTITIRYGIRVLSGDTVTVWNPSWKYARELLLNTTPAGAGVTGTVAGFPVSVKLTSVNFSFSQAKADGSDIRFTGADNTFLPYEIEQWDSANGAAALWVKVDTILGNNDSQFIVMYWGNSGIRDSSNSAAVFDTATSFIGVWHMAGIGNTTAYDATGNHYDGTPYNMTTASAVPGAIGSARHFNGTSQYIAMLNTASGKLNLPENGTYSLSAWIYADTLDSLWHAIAGKGHEQYYMQLKNFGNGRATWEFVEFQDQKGWYYTEDSTPPAPGGKTWLNLTGVRSGNSQRLYINGQLVKNGPSLMAGADPRTTSDNFMIGRFQRTVTIPYPQWLSYFKGRIDEVRISRTALSPDWIKLCYMNQRTDDKLLIFF
jgi:hypothetical protein